MKITPERFPVACLPLAGALTAGCVPLPGQAPTTCAEIGNGVERKAVDPRRLCGPAGSGRPVRPGVSRAAVRQLLRGVSHEPAWRFGDDDAPATEAYFFRNEARVFFLAPNPEGGLIGLLPRWVEYTHCASITTPMVACAIAGYSRRVT